MNSAMIARRVFTNQIRNSSKTMTTLFRLSNRNFGLFNKNLMISSIKGSQFGIRTFSDQASSFPSGQQGDFFMRERFISIPQDADLSPYSEIDATYINEYITSILVEEYGYSEDDIDYMLHFNAYAALPPDEFKGGVIPNITEYFMNRFGTTKNEAKEIILRYPRYMNMKTHVIENRIDFYQKLGMAGGELTIEDISRIFKENPFYFLCPLSNYPSIIGEMKKYRFTKEETIRLFTKAPGMLGLKKQSLKGIFDSGKFLLP